MLSECCYPKQSGEAERNTVKCSLYSPYEEMAGVRLCGGDAGIGPILEDDDFKGKVYSRAAFSPATEPNSLHLSPA